MGASDRRREESDIEEDYRQLEVLLRRGESRSKWIADNADRGIQSWRAAAESGDPRGQVLFGVCHFFGCGVEENEPAAAELFRQAAFSGDPQAEFSLAQCYLSGAGVAEDTTEAARLFRKAADRGIAPALETLGIMYFKGDGVPEDPDSAFDCWRIAAEQGYPAAQRLVGIAYLEGIGVEQDQDLAREWLLEAAEAGNEEAQVDLERLDAGEPAGSEDSDEDGSGEEAGDDDDGADSENAQNVDELNGGSAEEAVADDEEREECCLDIDAAQQAVDDGDVDLEQFTTIEPDAAAALSKYRGYSLRLNGLSNVTAEVARSLAASRSNTLELDGIQSLSDAAATALAEHRGGLCLNGLTTLSVAAAASLAGIKASETHRANVSLNGLTSITDEAAEQLGGLHGMLALDGLQSLTARSASALGRNCEDLSLDGLTALDADAAAGLSTVGSLSLNGLKQLDAEAATALSAVSRLSLDGLEEISDAAARAFAEGGSEHSTLSLDGVVRLSDEAALALGSRAGNTYVRGLQEISPGVLRALFMSEASCGPQLNSLVSLTDEVAAALAEYKGDVYLDGITEISDIAAEHLSRHMGTLWLQGLRAISAAAAESLSRHCGLMRTDCTNERRLELAGPVELAVWRFRRKRMPSTPGMPFEQRRYLMRDTALQFVAAPETVNLASFTHITRGASLALGGETGGWGAQMFMGIGDPSPLRFRKIGGSLSGDAGCEHDLDLSGLVELDGECASILAGNCGNVLDLSGLTELSSDLIGALGQVDFGYRGEIRLNGMRSLDRVAAHETYGVFGPIQFNGLEQLSPEIADALSCHSHNGDNGLSLDGIQELTPEAAAHIAGHGGWLSFNGLSTLSVAAANALAQHQAGLSLNGLRSLDEVLARALARHCGAVELGGLRHLSVEVATALSEHRNLLSLPGVTGLETAAAEAIALHDGEIILSGLVRATAGGLDALQLHPCVTMPHDIEIDAGGTTIPPALAKYPDIIRSLRSAVTSQSLQLVLAAITSLDDVSVWNTLQAGLSISQNGSVTVSPDAPLRRLVAGPHRVPAAIHILTRGRPGDVSRLHVGLGFLRPLSLGNWSIAPETCSLTSLDWLDTFPNLESLTVAGITQDVDMSPLQRLSRLRSVQLTDCASLPDLDVLTKLPELEILDLSGNEHLEDSSLSKLAILTNLHTIDLSGCGRIRDTSPLGELEGVEVVVGTSELDEQSDDDDALPDSAGPFSDPPGTITNSIGMKLVPIPTGEFLMGSPEDCPLGDSHEEFQHRVRITKPFLIGMHQVTQAQYERVTGENPSLFEGETLPVEHVTWRQASHFCQLLSSLPEELQAGRYYRLPTEAEWEYACRAGTLTPFNTGDCLTADQARFANTDRSSPKRTAPVGTYPPNAWGLFDMHGNVWEWTSDWFSADYFRESPVENPQGPATGTHHSLRGGSASVESHECRSTIRGEAGPVDGPDASGQRYPFYGDFGLRVVCVVSSTEP